MKFTGITKHFWLFGLLTGILVSSVVALFVTVWEWIENPSGIFHDENGTNWEFVFDTASSWFVPTFGYVTLIAILGHLLYSAIKWSRHRRK